MLNTIPVEVDSRFEGERVRNSTAYVTLGGEKNNGVELIRVKSLNDLPERKVIVNGPDLPEMEEGGSYPYGVFIEVGGKKLEEDLEGVFERRIHDFSNYINGFMHLNSRNMIKARISKESVKAGLRLEHVGEALIDLFKTEWEAIEKIRITIYTDKEKVNQLLNKSEEIFSERDEKIRGLSDEDADTFYGCVMCQSFATKQMCAITPERTPGCGSISWLVAKAAIKVSPDTSIFEIPKGDLIDPLKGEYSGINEIRKEKSRGDIEKVYLYSIFNHPHSTGLLEAVIFYIPEMDGIGIVHKDFHGKNPLGVNFTTLSKQIAIGEPMDGFTGVSVEYLRSKKFLIADGGWNRVIWISKNLKENIQKNIPLDLTNKIATEDNAKDLDELKEYLIEVNHPIIDLSNSNKETPNQQLESKQSKRDLEDQKKIEVKLENSKISVGRIVFK